MSAQDVVYRFDPRKMRVNSGDVPAGYWELHSCKLVRCSDLFGKKNVKREEIDLAGRIKSVEIDGVDESSKGASMLGLGAGALVGFRLFGPIGAIGGALAGQALVGTRDEVNVTVQLNDGTSFSALMDKTIYERLKMVAQRPTQSAGSSV